jgi:hypothetical protein|nr:hypothetical protein [Candidatus Krumholzibacteria bacterium]
MRTMILTAMILTLLAGLALAQDQTPPRSIKEQPVVSTSKALSADEMDTVQRNNELRLAKNEEMNTRLATEQTIVAQLVTELEASVTTSDRRAIQLRIQEAKQQTMVDLLAIQLKYARLGNHDEQAQLLEERIARLEEGLDRPQTPSTTLRSNRSSSQDGR